MESLVDRINSLENTARIPAMRGLVHAAMTRTIRALQAHIRNREYEERVRTTNEALDERNTNDINAQADESSKRAMRFEIRNSPYNTASLVYCVYSYANDELKTLNGATSALDATNRMQALTIHQMLDYMSSAKPRPPNMDELKKVAEFLGTDAETILFIQQMGDAKRQDQFLKHRDEIAYLFNTFGETGCETSFDDLDILDQHQLAVKVIDALKKHLNQTLTYIVERRRYTEMGSLALIRDGISQLTEWFLEFESTHRAAIHQATEEGRMLRALEDYDTELKAQRAKHVNKETT